MFFVCLGLGPPVYPLLIWRVRTLKRSVTGWPQTPISNIHRYLSLIIIPLYWFRPRPPGLSPLQIKLTLTQGLPSTPRANINRYISILRVDYINRCVSHNYVLYCFRPGPSC